MVNHSKIKELEDRLWTSADLLRANANLNASQYCMPVLGLLFLKYAYVRFKRVEAEISKDRPMRNGRTLPVTANDFVAKHIAPEVAEKEMEYRDAFHRLSQSDLQVFRLRYVLAKLSQYVDLARQGVFTAQMLDSYYDTDIEHILPFTPESDESKAKIEDYDRVKSMLGNLTLIEKPINRSIQNKITLYVPGDAAEAYAAHPFWGNFEIESLVED